MTDYVAFRDVDNEPISVDEYKQQNCKDKINCICGKKLHFRNESVYFERKGKTIQKTCHFSHYKGEKCLLPKEIKEKQSKFLRKQPELTLEEKRTKKIKTIIRKIVDDKRLIWSHYEELKLIMKKTKDFNINFEEIIKNYRLCSTLHNQIINKNSNNDKFISFKNIDKIKIEPYTNYIINELDYSIHHNHSISSSYYKHIINDYELYCKYLKNLSLILIYYSSRCYKEEAFNIKHELDLLNIEITKSCFIDDL